MELSRYIEPYMEPPVDLPEDSSAGFIAWCLFDSMGIQMEPDLLIEIEARNDVEVYLIVPSIRKVKASRYETRFKGILKEPE